MEQFELQREERRQDLQAVESRLTTLITGVRTDINGRLTGLEAFRQTVQERWNDEALKAAEQKGRLAVALFAVNVLGRNWRVVAAFLTAALLASGRLNISVGQ